jgi:hypothetical protein
LVILPRDYVRRLQGKAQAYGACKEEEQCAVQKREEGRRCYEREEHQVSMTGNNDEPAAHD